MPTLPSFTAPLTTRPRRPQLTPAKPRRLSPWYGHLISLAVLLLVYLAGYSGGRDAAPLSPSANHPVCHPNLKP
jgi:hypothetical protein